MRVAFPTKLWDVHGGCYEGCPYSGMTLWRYDQKDKDRKKSLDVDHCLSIVDPM